ncbi:MAG: hypothetical protein Q4G64_05470 [bacterium]|nr:hypothetical protein [bacterium]
MGVQRDRVTGILPWFPLGVVWFMGGGAAFAMLDSALPMLAGRRVFGSGELTVCDVPNVCVWTGSSPEEGALPLEAVTRGSQIFSAMPSLLLLAVVIAVLFFATRVVWEVSHGRVFAERTVRDLGIAAGLLIAGGVATAFLEGWAFQAAMADVNASSLMGAEGGMYAGARSPFAAVAVVFGLLALAAWAAFRHGQRVTAELEAARKELDGVV